ncbi:cytochrome c oxidase accessory protein CcoG [uncultured Salinisphaera sp.]|uniref:cytochrome c oxidase accessory protein CcoG n=1 Tax=uncultured Salinisphaera sp. TaxID=359372 RepID=UPI0032B29A7D
MTTRQQTHRNNRKGASAEAAPVQPISMYQSRAKTYPREIKGFYQRLRTIMVFVLLGLFYLLPWVPWNGRQAVLFDLPARQFHILGLTFWPQDFIYLTLLLVICALGLFFVTAVVGRVWCGYACPQTVWTEVFLWVESKIEGDRMRRIKLDRGPWNADKIWRKTTKHTIWVLLGLWTGFTFVGFFTPITDLGARFLTLDVGGWELFWTLFYGFATWGNAGFLRENVCLYMCPYARFQSAMFDRDTYTVSYDPNRGEPRGPRKRSTDPRSVGLGDCIDCTMCVQVCPTGIDIREGLQYECINCGACADACDTVMDRMNYPRGLIRYTSENALEGKRSSLLRPRVLVYAALLVVLASAFVLGIGLRNPLRMDILPDRNALYRVVDDTHVENVYTIKLMNMSQEPRLYRVEVEGNNAYSVDTDPERVRVAPGEVRNLPARVVVDSRDVQGGGHDIVLRAYSVDGQVSVSETTRFHMPINR